MSAMARSKSAERGLLNVAVGADKCKDRSVVRRIGRTVEQRTPGVERIASAMRAMTSGRRPSLTFGTHSIRTCAIHGGIGTEIDSLL